MMTFDKVKELASMVDATIDEVGELPDGSGFATISMPLPEDHWLYSDSGGYEPPPMTLRCGTEESINERLTRRELEDKIRAAAQYGVRAATNKGKDNDFDPDALVQNVIVGMLGYFTPDGMSDNEWANPK